MFISEPYFVANPKGKKEDDGYIVMSVYDHKIGKNRMIFLNAMTMKIDSDTTLPIRLPMTLHSQYFPKV